MAGRFVLGLFLMNLGSAINNQNEEFGNVTRFNQFMNAPDPPLLSVLLTPYHVPQHHRNAGTGFASFGDYSSGGKFATVFLALNIVLSPAPPPPPEIE